jgi:hypothetical protein
MIQFCLLISILYSVYLQLLISGMMSLEKSQAWSLWFGDMGASAMMNESGKNSAAY